MGVHYGGNGVVIDVAMTLGDKFDGCNSFFFRLVCEHRAESAVAYDADVGKLGAILFIYYEAAFVVDFEANVFEAKAGGVRAAADGYEDDVRVELEEGQRRLS